MKIHHLNCVQIKSPFGPAIGHCLLLEEYDHLTLVDAGIGLDETRNPNELLGKELVEQTGYVFDEELTAIKQIKNLGYSPDKVKNIVCSHLDPDHIGGLRDFPDATIHVSKEEYDSFKGGNPRYLSQQLSHNPKMELYEGDNLEWYGLPARKLNLPHQSEMYLIPLFGHTLGHCGIAIKNEEKWLFYIGDAYYYRAELSDENQPVDQLATVAAVDNDARIASLEKIKTLIRKRNNDIDQFSYHDPKEFGVSHLAKNFNL